MAPDGTAYERATALVHVGGDEEILAQLLDLFLDQAPRRVVQAEAALAGGDTRTLEREAHALKGTAATLGMPRLRDAASTVEQLCAEERLDEVGPGMVRMREALQEVIATLASAEDA